MTIIQTAIIEWLNAYAPIEEHSGDDIWVNGYIDTKLLAAYIEATVIVELARQCQQSFPSDPKTIADLLALMKIKV